MRAWRALVAAAALAGGAAIGQIGDGGDGHAAGSSESAAATRAAQDGLRKQAEAAMGRADYEGAKGALLRLKALGPGSFSGAPALEYNLACVHARLGERDAALDALEAAVAVGFVDFDHLARDPDLASIREEPRFGLMLLGRRELLDARGEADLESWREALGAGYRFERDAALRLNIASCFDSRTTAEAMDEVSRVAAWAAAVFPALNGAEARAESWSTLALPTREHFARLVPAPGVGGVYDHDRRALIAQELGASLRHEFMHVLHHRRMAALGQTHAWWVQEGLGALVEDVARDEGAPGGIRPVASWRTNIAKRLEKRGALTAWATLAAMPRDRFVGARPIANYAQARAVMLYMVERGVLTAWMREYESGFGEEPTGMRALERTLGETGERDYRAWLRALPEVAEEIRPGMASLGVVVGPGKGDGPVVEEYSGRRERAEDPAARLRLGDVITSVGGETVRTMEDLVRALSEREVGERVVVGVRRGTRRLDVGATLRAQEDESP